MMKGQIKRIVADKGFGFILADDGMEYFFHKSETDGRWDDVMEGDRVEFKNGRGPKGPRAEQVKLIGAGD